MIDLNELNYKDKILIDDTISYSKDYLKDSDILELNNVKVNGSIYVDYEKNNVIEFIDDKNCLFFLYKKI